MLYYSLLRKEVLVRLRFMNVVDSKIIRVVDNVFYTLAGLEIFVTISKGYSE